MPDPGERTYEHGNHAVVRMSRLLTELDEAINGRHKWVRHGSCGTTYEVATMVEDEQTDGAEKMCCRSCEDESPGSGYGFHPAPNGPSATEVTGGRSYATIAHAFLRGEGPQLSALEFRLVLALAAYEGTHASGWPKIEDLAQAVQVKKLDTVTKAIRRLVERGLVERWRPSRRGPNHYSVRPLLRGDFDGQDASPPPAVLSDAMESETPRRAGRLTRPRHPAARGVSDTPPRGVSEVAVEEEATRNPEEASSLREGRDCARPPEHAREQEETTTPKRRTAKPRIEGDDEAQRWTAEHVQAMSDAEVRRYGGPTARNLSIETIRGLLLAAAQADDDSGTRVRAPRAMA